ncbi:protein FAR-RED IMPAIRED RESPONSE 1-like isoform X2 [Tasmannia lanceolata]|uniref:protein FAR-RED IMPAIRED RESPONSE 1-like isoform X2 n=1 Tax=Tasmannia lanceolata TaxID=3420 RepID=UPI004064B35C
MEEISVRMPTIDAGITNTEESALGVEFDGAECCTVMNIEPIAVENAKENSLAREAIAFEGDLSIEPYVGMKFESREAAHSFYVEYAGRMGFRPTTRFSCRSRRNHAFISVVYACARFGFKQPNENTKKPRPNLRVDCKARMMVKRVELGRWVVSDFIKEHNHELDPEITMRSRGLTGKDSVNNTRKKQRESLAFAAEDVQAISEHFTCMQLLHPTFFYALELDEGQYLRNVFWADAKCRLDYTYFGDVVTFDTNYLTKKYRTPLATFVGVNHHGQSVLFGCALITDQTTASFVWVFKTWLRAMSERPPMAIITDHNDAMKAATTEVFPETRHRFCLWNILKQVPKKLGDICRADDKFMKEFSECIYDSMTSDEFERRWQQMIEGFDLAKDEWLRTLYEDRRQWVPTYLKDTFFAGMSTSQRNETINFVFDPYVSRKTTLKEFVEQYETALQHRCEKEAQADLETFHRKPSLKTPSPFEVQLASIYTRDIFKKFQVEVSGIVACHIINSQHEGTTTMYTVKDLEATKDFTVMWNAYEAKVSCICCLFEFKGFVCRHVMSAFVASGLYEIPSHYILKRWTKDAKCRHVLDRVFFGVQGDCTKSVVQRFNDLYHRSIKFAEEGSLSKGSYSVALRVLQETLERVSLSNGSTKILAQNKMLASNNHCGQEKEILLPLVQEDWSQSHYVQGGTISFGNPRPFQPVQHAREFGIDVGPEVIDFSQVVGDTRELATNGLFGHESSGWCQSIWQARDPYQ